jgi:hypothetical protein
MSNLSAVVTDPITDDRFAESLDQCPGLLVVSRYVKLSMSLIMS